MDSNCSTYVLGSKTDVACSWVGGTKATPLLSSTAHFAKQKTYDYFLLLQNMKFGDEKEKVPKPARIPPQTSPAGGKSAESILIPLEKSSRKV